MTSALFHSLWQGSVVACALALALLFVKSARHRYALSCAALVALPMLFLATIVLQTPAAQPPSGNIPAILLTPLDLPAGQGTFPSPAPDVQIVPLWLAGVAIFYAYRSFGWLAAQRLRRRAVCAVPQHWRDLARELALRIDLHRPVEVLESALAHTPVTIGAIRPVILLPLGLLAGLPSAQIEAVILHELAHIRRHDYLVNLLQTIVEGLLFYHPATWWISHTIRREREHCCDDIAAAATGDPLIYTQALAALEERRIQVPILAATGGPLMFRIQRLLTPTMRTQSPIPAVLFLILSSAALALAFHPEPRPEPRPEPMPAPAPQAAPQPKPQVVQQPAPPRPAEPEPAAETLGMAELHRRLEAALRAELEAPYRKWLNEEVVWIVTNEERIAFNRLQTDDERQRFIDVFWLRRDPTPDTEANEYREEHYRRIAWANDRFGAQIPGWQSDRGMIYVRFGPPDEKEEHPAEANSFAYEKWRYRVIEGVGSDVIIEFVDSNADGSFRMTWDPEEKNFNPQDLVRPPAQNIFERMRRFVEIRPRPAR